MQRRNALTHLGLVAGSLLAMPAWANGWSRQTLPATVPLFTADERATLAELAETIIPATDTPGANALGVGTYIETILADCYESAAQQTVRAGLATVNQLAQQQNVAGFVALAPAARLALLQTLTETDKGKGRFFPLLKGLVIQRYKTSDYFQTNIAHYELVPGRFHGSVKLPH